MEKNCDDHTAETLLCCLLKCWQDFVSVGEFCWRILFRCLRKERLDAEGGEVLSMSSECCGFLSPEAVCVTTAVQSLWFTDRDWYFVHEIHWFASLDLALFELVCFDLRMRKSVHSFCPVLSSIMWNCMSESAYTPVFLSAVYHSSSHVELSFKRYSVIILCPIMHSLIIWYQC